MRTAVLTEFGPWSASTRYRALQHVDRLRDRLGPVDVLLPDDRPDRRPGRTGQLRFFGSHAVRYLRRWRQLHDVLADYDAVLVQRGCYSLGPGLVAGALDRFPGRVVFDLDDAVFDVKPALQAKGPAARWLYGPQQAAKVLARADAVVVSTEVLADTLPRHDVPVHVLPTVPDPEPYAVSDQTATPAEVVWAGTVGGLTYLDPLRDVFGRLRDDQVGGLTVVSSAPWSGPSTFRRWTQAEEASLFADYAVGIMPLPDDPYTRGKAGFKLLQYMAAGLPVVASPVGVNTTLVERSGAGLLADTPAEWSDALATLLASSALRAELGDRGRSFVTGYADMDGQADVLAAVLRGDPVSPRSWPGPH